MTERQGERERDERESESQGKRRAREREKGREIERDREICITGCVTSHLSALRKLTGNLISIVRLISW